MRRTFRQRVPVMVKNLTVAYLDIRPKKIKILSPMADDLLTTPAYCSSDL